jgi:peptide chain release factor 1
VIDSVNALLDEHTELQTQLSDPAVHADAARAKKLNRRYAQLSQIKAAHEGLLAMQDDLVAARELAKEDAAFAAEVTSLEEALPAAQERRL